MVSRAPFAPSLWGCLRRFACSVAQHLSLSERIVRISQARRWFQHPQGGRQGVVSRAPFAPSLWGCLRRFACSVAQHPLLSEQILKMSQAIRWVQHPRRCAAEGVSHGPRSRPVCRDVSGGLPVRWLNIFRFRSRFRGCLKRLARFSSLKGGGRGGISRAPFAPSLWGCLRRFACSVAQHLWLSEQILRMSQAIRWFQHS